MSKQCPVKVIVDPARGAEGSLKKFKRLCESYGIVKEYRKRQAYKKPSIKKKEKTESSEKRRKKTDVKSRRGSRI